MYARGKGIGKQSAGTKICETPRCARIKKRSSPLIFTFGGKEHRRVLRMDVNIRIGWTDGRTDGRGDGRRKCQFPHVKRSSLARARSLSIRPHESAASTTKGSNVNKFGERFGSRMRQGLLRSIGGSKFAFKSGVHLGCIQRHLVDETLDAPETNTTFAGKFGNLYS